MKQLKMYGMVFILALLLTACGAGGGGGGDNPPPANPIPINPANGPDIADGVLGFITGVAGIGNMDLLGGIFGVGGVGAEITTADVFNEDISEICINDGTAVVEINDADNSEDPSVGDSATVTFSNCEVVIEAELTGDENWMWNGAMAFEVLGLTDTGLSLAITFSGLSVGDTSLGGGYVFEAGVDEGWFFNISGDLLSATDEDGTFSISDFLLAYHQLPTGHQVEYSGRFTNPEGYVDFVTTMPFKWFDLDEPYPYEGVMVITGAVGTSGSNTSIRITALSGDGYYVQMEVDGNGDGSYDDTPDPDSFDEMSWPAIFGDEG